MIWFQSEELGIRSMLLYWWEHASTWLAHGMNADDLQFPDKCYQLYAKDAKNADDLQFPDKCYQLYVT